MSTAPEVVLLAEAARQGDRSALDRLLALHLRVAHTVALGSVRHYEEAQDVVQTAFLSVVEHLHDCRDVRSFTAWLLQIVRNTSIGARRSAARRQPSRDDPEALSDVQLNGCDWGAADRSDARRVLLAALRVLTERQRQVLLLHDLEGWKHQEIAKFLTISEVMSRQELFVARRAARAYLDRTEVTRGVSK